MSFTCTTIYKFLADYLLDKTVKATDIETHGQRSNSLHGLSVATS